jgi:hypothetical protein
MDPQARQTAGLFLPALFSFLSLVFYGPATYWFVNRTLGQEQLLHAFIILALAGAYILMQRKDRITLSFDFGPAATRFLIFSFIIVGLSGATGWPLLIIPAYAMALLGWLLFIFGDHLSKTLIPIMIGFGAYLLLIFLLPLFDWPLRYLAGRYSLTLLYYLGYQAQLFYASGEEPKLLLDNNGNIFEVAAECNGFGVLGGCLMLTILLVSLREGALDRPAPGHLHRSAGGRCGQSRANCCYFAPSRPRWGMPITWPCMKLSGPCFSGRP